MTTLNRYRVIWSGGPGGQGVSTFFSETSAITALADIRAFFSSAAGLFSTALTFSFPNSGDQIESTTGTLTGAWTQAAAATVTGADGGAPYAAGIGMRIRWGTGTIVGGRRLVGTTFLTSLTTDAYASDGTLDNGFLTSVQGYADALVATDSLVIWSRPRNGVSGYGSVESAVLPDRVTSLRSRRY